MICFLSIDPGVKVAHAWALYNPENKIWHLVGHGVIKEIKCRYGVRRNKSMVNIVETVALFRQLLDTYAKVNCVIENVHPMPKQGVVSSGNLMRSLGIIEGICVAFGVSRYYVHPATWKRKLGITADKGSSLYKAQSLFPQVKFVDHNDAEAALMLHYFLQHQYTDMEELRQTNWQRKAMPGG